MSYNISKSQKRRDITLSNICVDVVLSYDDRGVSVLQYGAEEEIRRRETSKGEEPQTDGGARETS